MIKLVRTIAQSTIEEVTADICERFCKYPETWEPESEGVELYEREICKNCPLNRLTEDPSEREGAKE